MLFTIENHSDIQTYFQKAQYKSLQGYFNSSMTMKMDDFLKGKGNLSIYKFLLIDIHSLDGVDLKQFKKVVANYFGIAYFYSDPKRLPENLVDNILTDNVLGIFDLSLPQSFNSPMAKSISKFLNADTDLITPEDIQELGEEISQILTKVEKEMIRVKKIHSHIMPKRAHHFKNLIIESKFASGEAPGGEFFDVFESSNKTLIFLTSSNSYLTSTLTLSSFNNLKDGDLSLNSLEKALVSIEADLKTLQETKNKKIIKLEVLVGIMNLKSMEFEGFNFGQNAAISSQKKSINTTNCSVSKSEFAKAKFHLKLERGESLAITSAGLKKNCQDVLDGQGYLEYICRGFTLHKNDLMNEVFFHLRKNVESEFLAYDATLVNLKVDSNSLVEV
jgi:hypothetical protein